MAHETGHKCRHQDYAASTRALLYRTGGLTGALCGNFRYSRKANRATARRYQLEAGDTVFARANTQCLYASS